MRKTQAGWSSVFRETVIVPRERGIAASVSFFGSRPSMLLIGHGVASVVPVAWSLVVVVSARGVRGQHVCLCDVEGCGFPHFLHELIDNAVEFGHGWLEFRRRHLSV